MAISTCICTVCSCNIAANRDPTMHSAVRVLAAADVCPQTMTLTMTLTLTLTLKTQYCPNPDP